VFSALFLITCESSKGASHNVNQQVLQGTRILGMDIHETPTITFDTAYNEAIMMGVRESSLSLDWNLLEPNVGNYEDTIPDIINLFYPSQISDLTLIIRPLDTAGKRYPSGLTGNFDDRTVITTFENFLTHLHSRLTALNSRGKLKWIQIGNEIDAYLGDNPTKWAQWKTFFLAAKAKIKTLWPKVEVSTVIQFNTLQDKNILDQYLSLLPSLDNASLTYYPLESDFTIRPPDTVDNDFDLMVRSIPDKYIFLQECGYPSSTINLSSKAQQADFISQVFNAWDKHLTKIKIIDFSWQYDISDEEASQYVIDYGLSETANENEFKNYLSSIGLSHNDGTKKPALQQLRNELNKRKWK